MNRQSVSPFGRPLNLLGRAGWWWSLALLALAGCYDQPAIRQYTVPKESSLASTSGGSGTPSEILGAIAPEAEDAWFFKLMGDPEKVQQYKSEFRQLVSSVSFDDSGKPRWQLPEKWREEAGGQFVYASLRPPGEESVKISVSPLPMPADLAKLDETTWQQYVVANVNRWRGQVGLADQSWEQISSELEKIENLSKERAPAYFVTLRGTAASGGGMGMAMGSPATNAPEMPAAGARERPSGRGLQFELPDNWHKVPPLSVIALESFQADGPDGTKADVTLTSAGGDTQSNVVRWSSQIGGSAELATKALSESKKLTVNGAQTEVVFLAGPEKDSQAIMAAMIQWNPQSTLFVKMVGPVAAVESQRDAFMSFTQSLKW